MSEAKFLTPLRTEKIGERRWLLTDNLVFQSAKYPGKFIAPRGFQHDFASIPRWAWVCFPKVGNQDKAAVIHDGGYGHVLITENGDRIYTVKFVADNLFLEAMLAEGVNGLSARMMYRAVSWFGDPREHPLRQAA